MLQIFMAVLNMSIASAFLLILVLIGRMAMRWYSMAGFRYFLWLPLLFRLLVPYSLPSILSVYNLFHRELKRPSSTLMAVVYFDPELPQNQTLDTPQTIDEKKLIQLACAVWLLGVVIMLAIFLVQYLHLFCALKKATSEPDYQMQPLCNQVGLHRPPPVLYTDAVKGPMVFGLLRPSVLMPPELEQKSNGRNYILLHEFSHIRCWDHIILLLGYIALSLHWFNPLIWVARTIMAQDIEQACDQRVLKRVGEQEQLLYAQTLVDWAKEKQRRFGLTGYAAFGDKDVVSRIKSVVNWKRLPFWAEILLVCATVMAFLCTATNPILPNNTYLPVSSPLISKEQYQRFQQAAYRVKQALETGDAMELAQQASMDPEYFAPLYDNIGALQLRVDSMQLFCNSNSSAELYMEVEVQGEEGVYAKGKGTLVAHLKQTTYREEPLVDYLMPQQKYENAQLADTDSEAARLALRMCENLQQENFDADSLSGVTVARVCMASAIEDKGEQSPFTPQRMQELAKEYFNLDDFSCYDSSVYDSQTNLYYYTATSKKRMVVTEMKQEGDDMQVVVEAYEDPLCLYPLQRLECKMVETK